MTKPRPVRLPKFQTTVFSRRSGTISHVVRAVDEEAAALRVLSSYPVGTILEAVKPVVGGGT